MSTDKCDCACDNAGSCALKYLKESITCPCNTCLIKVQCTSTCKEYNDFDTSLYQYFNSVERQQLRIKITESRLKRFV